MVERNFIVLGVGLLIIIAAVSVFYPIERSVTESPTPSVCINGETRNATCPDGVTTYLNENCVEGKWHQVMYIRNPCEPLPTTTLDGIARLANPASVYCEEQGGKVIIRTNANGSQTGYCILPDGTECEEWAFYRKECPS